MATMVQAAGTIALGSYTTVVGPTAGSSSAVVAAPAGWTAATSASWVHLTNVSGTSSAPAVFAYDANAGATRSGDITFSSGSSTVTLAVTQAGENFAGLGEMIPIFSNQSLENLQGLTVDPSGNVYFSDQNNGSLYQLNQATQQLTPVVSYWQAGPAGLAVDKSGNVYVAGAFGNQIGEWNADTQQFTVLVSSGLNFPCSVAVDSSGNVYIADTNNNAIKEWNAITQQVTTLVSTGLNAPKGVAVDAAGNVYIADSGNAAVKEWNPVTQQVTTLGFNGLSSPSSVTVDAAGNVYETDSSNNASFEWDAAIQQMIPLAPSGLLNPTGIALDSSGNVYLLNSGGSIDKLSIGFAGTAETNQTLLAGAGNSQVLMTALPYGAALPWEAATTASWIHLTSPGGTIPAPLTFTYDANTGATRSGVITLNSGAAAVTVTQTAAGYVAAGALTTLVSGGLNTPYGVAVDSSGNVYVADTKNSAIKEWVASTQQVTTLVSSGLNNPSGVAVDGAGNIYIADTGNNAIKEWNAATQQVTTLVSSGLSNPRGIAIDSVGNIYIADTLNNAVREWNASKQQITTLVANGLSAPEGVAVDGVGNVYIADSSNNAIKEWNAASGQVTTLVSGGLNSPAGVAVDGAGNVYIADNGNNALKQWNASTQQVTTLASTTAQAGLNGLYGLAADANGNIYISNISSSAILEWTPAYIGPLSFSEPYNAGSDQLLPVLPSSTPLAVTSDQTWLTPGPASGGVLSFSFSANTTTAPRVAHLSVLGQTITVSQVSSGPYASLNTQSLTFSNISDASTSGAQTVILTNSGSATLSLGGVAVSGTGFVISGNNCGASLAVQSQCSVSVTYTPTVLTTVTGTLTFTDNSVAGSTQTVQLSGTGVAALSLLPSSELPLVGPAAGSGTVTVGTSPTGSSVSWSATPNSTWLHTTSSGGGAGVLSFTYDANSGANRTGTISVGNLTLTVAQAGSAYVSGSQLSTMVAGGLNQPGGVAVDGAGNIYIADTQNNAIKKWSSATQQLTTLVSSGLNLPAGVAVDWAGNVYIADTANNAVKKWSAATQQVSTLVSSGLSAPGSVAVDAAGNVYISDTSNNAVKQWSVATGQVTTLITGLTLPGQLAVDAAGNVYVAYYASSGSAIKEWNAATQQVTSPVSSGLSHPLGVAVDGSGNIYISDSGNNTVKEWNTAAQKLTTLVTSLNNPNAVAVDGSGDVYIADTGNNAVRVLVTGLINPTAVSEAGAGGTDQLPPVLAAGPPLVATSDQTWLTVGTLTNGVLSFSFAANPTGASRVAHIGVLGQSISVTQGVPPLTTLTLTPQSLTFSNINFGTTSAAQAVTVANTGNQPLVLATAVSGSGFAISANTCSLSIAVGAQCTVSVIFTPPGAGQTTGTLTFTDNSSAGSTQTVSLTGTGVAVLTFFPASQLPLLGAGAGSSQVLVGVSPVGAQAAWSATPNASWLHTTSTGTAAGTLAFSYDANGGVAARTGTISLGALSLTVTQAGSAAVPFSQFSTVVGGLGLPQGVAVDASNNVYVADPFNNTIQEWNPATQQFTTLLSGFASPPISVALDSAGNIYFVESGNNSLLEWNAGTRQVTTLAHMQFLTYGVATDNAGNQYVAEYTMRERNAVTGQVSNVFTYATALDATGPVAVDALGNVYFINGGTAGAWVVSEWSAATRQVTAVPVSGLSDPYGLAVDGAGNLYISDQGNNSLYQYVPATQQTNTLVSGGLSQPGDVAVDGNGNVYVADTYNNALEEYSTGFVSAGSLSEAATAGTDQLQVLPASTVVTAASDSAWLTIGTVANGAVHFAFAANPTSAARVANISLLGLTIPVTQAAASIPNAALSISSLTFATQTVGVASGAQPVTVSNTGNTALAITSIAVTGSNASDYSETNNCGTSLAASAACTISVTFKPAAAGTRTASVVVTDNAGNVSGAKQSVTLTGAGVASATAAIVSLTPASGSGALQAFRAVYSDSSGASDLANVRFLMSSSTSAVNACYVIYYPASNALYLYNDAGSAMLGPLTPGSTFTTLSNSQCALIGAGSSATSSGHNLSVVLNLAFSPAFDGARNVYLEAFSSAGNTGLVKEGSYTVMEPSAALSPASLTFASQEEGVASAAQSVTLSNPGNAALTISGIALTGANPTDYAETNNCGTSLAASASCTVSVTFKPTVVGVRTAVLTVTDNSGGVAGSTQTTTLSGTGAAGGPPAVVSLSPSSGSGLTQTFTAVYSDPNGLSDLGTAKFLINTAISGVSACDIYYVRSTNAIYMFNDSDNTTLGPLKPGSSSSLSNSQCTLSGSGTSVTTSGNTLTVNFATTFQSAFAGLKNIYMEAINASGSANSGWVQEGTWTPAATGPIVVSLSPASGSGLTQTFTAVYSDSKGLSDLGTAKFLINTAISGVNACDIYYVRSSNAFYLFNNADSATLGPLTPGSSSSLSNSQCTLSGSGTSVTTSGNTLTINLALTFQSTFVGLKNVYTEAINTSGSANSGWVQKGTWTPAAAGPSVVSLSPSSGTGQTQTFTAVYADSNGLSDLGTAKFLINTAISGVNACDIYYVRSSNALYLFNDTDSTTLGPLTPGSSSSLSNSQCTLSGSGSSITSSGKSLTANFVLTFGSSFTGTKNVYMEAVSSGTSGTSGWVLEGTWTP